MLLACHVAKVEAVSPGPVALHEARFCIRPGGPKIGPVVGEKPAGVGLESIDKIFCLQGGKHLVVGIELSRFNIHQGQHALGTGARGKATYDKDSQEALSDLLVEHRQIPVFQALTAQQQQGTVQ